jgi:triosephosphate isomerase (TIM)
MKHPIFAANWKMNHGPSAARSFIRAFVAHFQRQYDRTVIFFPSAVSVQTVADECRDRPDLLVGIQNLYWGDQGAFTGEVSAPMARDAGARVALVGHSERRHIFGESDEATAEKCAAAERAGLRPMLCVGETLAQREAGQAVEVVLRQLRTGLSKLNRANIPDMMIAYEPVWAIGTGRNATPADASEMHQAIRQELKGLAGDRGGGVHILYGGSVNTGNAPLLLGSPDVDGLLVGGASLNPSDWTAIVRA